MADGSGFHQLIPPGLTPPLTAPAGNWSIPTRVRIGPGRIIELDDVCRELGVVRPIIVTDNALSTSSVIETIRTLRPTSALFDGIHRDPTQLCVDAGARSAREHAADAIIAVGGGSALDAGKLIALSIGQSRPIDDYLDGHEPDLSRVRLDLPPVIAIPTTAGTGSEVGRAAVLSDTESKRIIFHPALLPRSVICDAALTTTLPPTLTVGTGMDALSHALEAYCASGYHPIADGIAAEAIGLVLAALPVAVGNPDDLAARQQMLVAALMGATAFQKGLGLMHALSHQIGARCGTHHGMTNGVLMPYVLTANQPAIAGRLDELARRFQIPGGARGFITMIVELRAGLAVPATLAELCPEIDIAATDGFIETVSLAAVRDPSAPTNPIPVTVELCREVLTAAFRGELVVT